MLAESAVVTDKLIGPHSGTVTGTRARQNQKRNQSPPDPSSVQIEHLALLSLTFVPPTAHSTQQRPRRFAAHPSTHFPHGLFYNTENMFAAFIVALAALPSAFAAISVRSNDLFYRASR